MVREGMEVVASMAVGIVMHLPKVEKKLQAPVMVVVELLAELEEKKILVSEVGWTARSEVV